MPLFYIDIHTGQLDALDDEGIELPSLAHAVALVQESLVDQARRMLAIDTKLVIAARIRDGDKIVHTARFAVEATFRLGGHEAEPIATLAAVTH